MPTSKQEPEAVREKICQLENRQKILLNWKTDLKRKERTHRLIERGAILESVFPEIIPMTGDQIKAFLEEKRCSRKVTGQFPWDKGALIHPDGCRALCEAVAAAALLKDRREAEKEKEHGQR